MRFNPWKCPKCGQTAEGMLEKLFGVAGLIFDPEGSADYDGGTNVDWNSQLPVRDGTGRVTLECSEGHQWQATPTEDVPV